MLLLFAAPLWSGCAVSPQSARTVTRYVDLPVAPEVAMTRVKEEAKQRWVHIGGGAAPADTDKPSDRSMGVHVEPRGRGTRVALSITLAEKNDPLDGARTGDAPFAPLDAVLTQEPSFIVRPSYEIGWHDRFVWDYQVGMALFHDSNGANLGSRVDLEARVGWRLQRFGGPFDDRPRARVGVSILAGFGGAVWSSDNAHGALRPSLTLSIDRQQLFRESPKWLVPVTPRWAFDLTVGGLFVDDGRKGIEGGVAIRLARWGGVFARAGVLRGPGGGFNWTVGIQAGSEPSIYASAGALLAMVLLLALLQKAGGGIGKIEGGG